MKAKRSPRSNRRPVSAPRGCRTAAFYVRGFDSLVLKSDGAVAWIAVNFPAPSPSTGVSCGNEIPPVTEVRRYDSRGLQVIGQGASIEPASLRLHGSTLTWVDEGMSDNATLL